MVLMTLSRSFYNPPKGGIIKPQPGEQPILAMRHAVVAIGHGVIGGDRVILIRNSWGVDWGVGGCAWLTESFLTPRLILLRHKYQSLLGLFHPLAQHGQRGSVRANWTVMARRTVAIELVT